MWKKKTCRNKDTPLGSAKVNTGGVCVCLCVCTEKASINMCMCPQVPFNSPKQKKQVPNVTSLLWGIARLRTPNPNTLLSSTNILDKQ